jgi:hypothetical protein
MQHQMCHCSAHRVVRPLLLQLNKCNLQQVELDVYVTRHHFVIFSLSATTGEAMADSYDAMNSLEADDGEEYVPVR